MRKGEPFDQVKYQNDYIRENYDRISLAFPKGEKAAIKEAARKEGVSMSEYILAAVAEKMGRKNKADRLSIDDSRDNEKKSRPYDPVWDMYYDEFEDLEKT